MEKIRNVAVIISLALVVCIYFYWFSSSFKDQPTPPEVTLKENNKTYNLLLEDYLVGVVACEMNASYNIEALKAQAIAARTYALYKVENSNQDYDVLPTTSDQCYLDESGMRKKWQNTYDKYYKIVEYAVMSTKNIVMNKNKKLFKSFYFSTSNGHTQDSKSVFSEGNITSVDSLWDKTSKNYEVKTTFTFEKLKSILGNFNNIKIISRDKYHNVTKIKVDNKEYTGIKFRKLLNLRNTDFCIKKHNNSYEITTYGYGHGVGMSQYGANYLANQGYDYKYILNYYYNNVEFVTYNV